MMIVFDSSGFLRLCLVNKVDYAIMMKSSRGSRLG